MKWADVSMGWKLGSGGMVVVLSAMGYLSSTFYTRVEAQQYQQYNNQQIALFRVQQVEAQIEAYRFQLLSAQLTPEQREWITAEIARLQTVIACIRAGTC